MPASRKVLWLHCRKKNLLHWVSIHKPFKLNEFLTTIYYLVSYKSFFLVIIMCLELKQASARHMRCRRCNTCHLTWRSFSPSSYGKSWSMPDVLRLLDSNFRRDKIIIFSYSLKLLMTMAIIILIKPIWNDFWFAVLTYQMIICC